MSIEDEIADRVEREMLFPLQPAVAGDRAIRALLVSERLWGIINSPEGDDDWERRVGELRADLEVFVTQKNIDPKYLFLLFPAQDAVWEIRSVRPDPSIRVPGLFAQKDAFIATEVALRIDLGGWQSRAWKQIKRNAKAAWRKLFSSYDPINTTNVNDVVTGAVNGKYFK